MRARASTPASDDISALFARYQSKLRAQVRRLINTSEANIEDACSFAWMKLLRQRQQPESVYRWLLTVAVHEAVKLDRGSRRALPLSAGEEDELLEPPDSREPIEIREQLLDAAAAVTAARLSEPEARILALQLAGLSYDEISQRTGHTSRTIERQLLRAKRKLARARQAQRE